MANGNLTRRLLDEVVIFESGEGGKTGAEALTPAPSPRPDHARHPPPQPPLAASDTLQRQVEQFLFHQSEMLDGRHWQSYIDLFAEDAVYWMPITPDQTEWLDTPSIFAEDRPMMQVRMGRLTHPNAWSQAPHWETSHLVGNVAIESASAAEVRVRSRFQMLELRRDALRHFAGTYRHVLERDGAALRIKLQRVDLINSQAPFDYVLQAWV
jgi:3-phenylpropionate/cinnamic acid dioxygenase small subunit